MKILTLLLLTTLLAKFDISAQVSVVGRFDLNTSNTIPDKIFGINVFQGFDPNQAGFPGNANYKKQTQRYFAAMARQKINPKADVKTIFSELSDKDNNMVAKDSGDKDYQFHWCQKTSIP